MLFPSPYRAEVAGSSPAPPTTSLSPDLSTVTDGVSISPTAWAWLTPRTEVEAVDDLALVGRRSEAIQDDARLIVHDRGGVRIQRSPPDTCRHVGAVESNGGAARSRRRVRVGHHPLGGR